MWVKVEDPSMISGAMLLQRHHPNDFFIDFTSTTEQISVQVGNENAAGSCPGISNQMPYPEWMSVSLSLMSDGAISFVLLFCNQNIIVRSNLPDIVENASGSYRIG